MMRKLSANCREKGMGYGAGDRARELFVLASPNIVKRYTTWKHCVLSVCLFCLEMSSIVYLFVLSPHYRMRVYLSRLVVV